MNRRRQIVQFTLEQDATSTSKSFAAKTLLRLKGMDVINYFPRLIKSSPWTMFENRRKKTLILSFDNVKIEYTSGEISIWAQINTSLCLSPFLCVLKKSPFTLQCRPSHIVITTEV